MNKTIKDMAQLIKEYKEYQTLQAQLKEQMETLKAEAIEILGAEAIDEYVCDEGKITYREVITKRFDATAFKKSEWAELYKEYTKESSSLRFTCN